MKVLSRARLSLIILIAWTTPGLPGSRTSAQTPGTVRITQQQLAEFTSTVERAVKTNDAALLQGLIAWDTIKDKATKGIDCHPTLHEKFWAKVESGLAADWVSGQHFLSLRGEFRFRRLIQRNGQTQTIFRSIDSGGEGTYVILSVMTTATGKLRIVDFEQPTLGMSFVRDSRYSYAVMSRTIGKNVGATPTPIQAEFLRDSEEFRRLEQLVIVGDARSALKVYANLTPEFQNDLRAKAFRLQAAILLRAPESPEYRDAVNDLLSATRDSLTRSFVLMGYHFATGNLKAGARELANVKTFVGQDGWLDTEFALNCVEHGDLNTGRVYAENAVKTEPHRYTSHMALMTVAVGQVDFVAAAESLKHMDAIEPLNTVKHLESHPHLKQFVLSQPYLQWKEMRFKDELERERRVAREAKAFFESLESK